VRRSLPGVCRGFTLIELLVSVAISGILIGAALASYRGMSAKQQVKQAGISLVTDLKSFQQKASAGQKPSDCVGQLSGYRVIKIASEDTNYRMQPVCTTSSPAEKTINLPEGITFQTDTFDLFFPVLGGLVTGAQTIIVEKDSYRYQVTIEAFGVIRGEML